MGLAFGGYLVAMPPLTINACNTELNLLMRLIHLFWTTMTKKQEHLWWQVINRLMKYKVNSFHLKNIQITFIKGRINLKLLYFETV